MGLTPHRHWLLATIRDISWSSRSLPEPNCPATKFVTARRRRAAGPMVRVRSIATAGSGNTRRVRSGHGRGGHGPHSDRIWRSNRSSAGCTSARRVVACTRAGVSPMRRLSCTSIGPSAPLGPVNRTRAPPLTPRWASNRPTAPATRSTSAGETTPRQTKTTSPTSRTDSRFGAIFLDTGCHHGPTFIIAAWPGLGSEVPDQPATPPACASLVRDARILWPCPHVLCCSSYGSGADQRCRVPPSGTAWMVKVPFAFWARCRRLASPLAVISSGMPLPLSMTSMLSPSATSTWMVS